MQEEILGSLLPFLTFQTYDGIVNPVKSLSKPLALCLFSEDKALQQKVLQNISFGGRAINDTVIHFLNSNMPVDGVADAHGLNSFLAFSHRKSVLANTAKIDLPARYAPYKPYKTRIFRMLIDRKQSTGKFISMVLLSLFFIVAGIAHFTNPSFYLEMMPPAIPFHKFMVYLSGFLEISLGLLLLLPKWRSLAAWSLIGLLIAVFPANIYMFANSELFPDVPTWAHYVRLPFQAVFIYWAYIFTKKA